MVDSFDALLRELKSPQGIKPAALKTLYSFLLHLTSNAPWSKKKPVSCHHSDLEISHEIITEALEDISELANVLFKELEKRFERLFSELCGIFANKEARSSLGLSDAIEVLNFLFRCCIVLLTLLELNLVLEKGLILCRILKKLISPNLVEDTGESASIFEKSVFRDCTDEDNGCSTSSVEGFTISLQFLEPDNHLLFLKTTMLEVFVDELLAHQQLTGLFKKIDSVASINERLFNPLSAQGDTGIVIETICNHFILSYSDKKAFEDFLSRLFCTHAIEHKYPFRAPALGVTAATSLLLSPVMASAPKYVQAHLISMVSEAIHVKSLKPDRKLMNCFLSTFEKSVCLYMTHMSCVQTDDHPVLHGGCISSSSHGIVYAAYQSYVSLETKNKVDTLISKLDSLSNQDMYDNLFRMKSDVVSSSMRFVKECQSVYAISCQEEILNILSCLVLKASESYDDKAIRPVDGSTLQNLYLLASLLKLVGVSLLQAIQCLRHSEGFGCLRTLNEYTSCKEYDFILGTITCFRDLDISLPLQQMLSSLMSSHSKRHMDSKMMFLHFSGLMSLSFCSGLECLVKACLLTMFAVLNLFVFEEGDLDSLQSLVDYNNESFSSGSPVVRMQERVVDQNYSLVVASRFHKIRSLYSSALVNKHSENASSRSQTVEIASNMEADACLEEETEETTDGEIFLKCMLGVGDISKFDDLVDFVECKRGKDYSFWLKNRQKYRKWKSEKLAVMRWKRKKKSTKILKCKRN